MIEIVPCILGMRICILYNLITVITQVTLIIYINDHQQNTLYREYTRVKVLQ